jgi:sarcosine oxidase
MFVDPSGVYFHREATHILAGFADPGEPDEYRFKYDGEAWFEDRIWPALAERVPVFEAIKVISSWVGHYDYNALDQNGIIGFHSELRNFILANGFSGHGFQQGPATGNAVAELIIHGEFRTIDLTRFGYERIARNEPLFEKNVI